MNYPDYFMIVSDIEGDAKAELPSCIEQCIIESGLHGIHHAILSCVSYIYPL